MDAYGSKPTCFDTLPFQFVRLCKYLIFLIPAIPGMVKEEYLEQKRLKEEKLREQEEYEEEKRRREEEKIKKKEQKAQRKRVSQFKEAAEEEECILASPDTPEETYVPKNGHQMWTDDDLVTLSKLIKKIPGGSMDRWDCFNNCHGRKKEPSYTIICGNVVSLCCSSDMLFTFFYVEDPSGDNHLFILLSFTC